MLPCRLQCHVCESSTPVLYGRIAIVAKMDIRMQACSCPIIGNVRMSRYSHIGCAAEIHC